MHEPLNPTRASTLRVFVGCVPTHVAVITFFLCIVLAEAAAAHFFWPTFHSAKSAISLDEEGLEAVVVLEVPTIELVADFKEFYADVDLLAEIEAGGFEALEDKYRDARLESFAKELILEIDGRSPAGSWRPVDTPINGKGTEGFFVYMLEFAFAEAPELAERVRVRVLNKAFPDLEVVMANVAEAGGAWEVAESSIPPREELPDLPPGAMVDEELGLWTMDPAKRDLQVVFVRKGS